MNSRDCQPLSNQGGAVPFSGANSPPRLWGPMAKYLFWQSILTSAQQVHLHATTVNKYNFGPEKGKGEYKLHQSLPSLNVSAG